MAKNKKLLSVILILCAASLWGTAGIFIRNLEGSISQINMVMGRAFFATVIYAGILLFKNRLLFKIKLRDLPIFACCGIFSIVMFNFCYYKTMQHTTLSVAAVLLYTAPFFVVIISALFFKARITIKKLAACILAFIGCCMVSGLFDSAHSVSAIAVGYGLLTGFGYALYTVFGDILIKRGYHTLTINFYVFLTAAIGCAFLTDFRLFAIELTTSFKSTTVLALMAIFNTVLPYILYTSALYNIDASSAPIIAIVEPVVATLIGTFIYSEPISAISVLGIAVILGAVVMLNLTDKKIKLKANSKINLALAIKGVREDGYHLIDTIMQSVSLYDTITIKKAKTLTVVGTADIPEQENIAYKAAKEFFSFCAISGGAKISIKKRIPKAAGLGGGSADAAAVLIGLNMLYKTDLAEKDLCEIALKLGADVPFFIKGSTVRCEGIGEIMSECSSLSKGAFVIVKQGKKPSTAQMYRKLDSKEYENPDISSVIKALENQDLYSLCENMGNSFCSVFSDEETHNALSKTNALGIGLSGSGPSLFAVYDNPKLAKKASRQLRMKGFNAYFALPTSKAVIVE